MSMTSSWHGSPSFVFYNVLECSASRLAACLTSTLDYHKGDWLTNLRDTEKIVDYFYDTCFEGAENCPLWSETDKSAKDIRDRVDKLISDADDSPISFVQNDGSSNLRVITGTDIRQVFVR